MNLSPRAIVVRDWRSKMVIRLVASTFLVLWATASFAQVVPPLPAETPSSIDSARVGLRGKVANPNEASVRSFLQNHPWVVPTTLLDDAGILAYWGKDSTFNPADQVQFLYGFGGEQRKGLAADLVALLFPAGVRVAVGSSVATTSDATTSTAEAIQRLRDGGDMYVSLAYPLISAGHTKTGHLSADLFFAPRTSFLINGFAGAQTITEATEVANNLGFEGFVQLKDLEGKGGAFVYTRFGLQHVGADFQKQTGLDSQTYGAFQIAVGAVFSDLLRVSFQHFHLPPGVVGVTANQLGGWHLVVQLAPVSKKKSS